MKYGRKPRSFNPRVPHYAAMRMMPGLTLPVLRQAVHNLAGAPPDLGVMNNDEWGCCTIAGLGHDEQLLTLDATGTMVTVSNDAILDGYAQATGCDITAGPSNPTDAGGNEQDVLTWAMRVGLLQPDGTRRPLLGFVEIDPRNIADVCEAIQETGAAYIGFTVPEGLPENAGDAWLGAQLQRASPAGHCVIVPGYDLPAPAYAAGQYDYKHVIFDVSSWGLPFTMDRAFWDQWVDECYALLSPLMFRADGTSPWGMTLEQVETLMQAIRK